MGSTQSTWGDLFLFVSWRWPVRCSVAAPHFFDLKMGTGCSICSGVSIQNGGNGVRRNTTGPWPIQNGQGSNQQETRRPSNRRESSNQQNILDEDFEFQESRKPDVLYGNLFEANPQKLVIQPGNANFRVGAVQAMTKPPPAQPANRPVPVGCENDDFPAISPIQTETAENDKDEVEKSSHEVVNSPNKVENSSNEVENSSSGPKVVDSIGSTSTTHSHNTKDQEIADQYFAGESRRDSEFPDQPLHPSPTEPEIDVQPRNSFLLKTSADNFVDNVLAKVMVAQAEMKQFDSENSMKKDNELVHVKGTDSLYSATSSSSFIKQVLNQIAEDKAGGDSAIDGCSKANALDKNSSSVSFEKKCSNQSNEYEMTSKTSEKPIMSQPSQKLPLGSDPQEVEKEILLGNQQIPTDVMSSNAQSMTCSASSSIVDLHAKDIVDDTLGKVVSDLSSCFIAVTSDETHSADGGIVSQPTEDCIV